VQLAGKPVSVDDLKKSCELMLFYNKSQEQVINPCGLIAWSNFNDTYEVGAQPQSWNSSLEGAVWLPVRGGCVTAVQLAYMQCSCAANAH
jgi:hypothetical protein